MDIIGIMTGVAPYGLVALIVSVAVICGACILYRLYKKKGGTKIISKSQACIFFLLMCWLVVVLGLTTFSRGANYSGWFNFQMFSGYVNAWNNWSLSEFQLILFNMLMFLPLGFLLPLLSKYFREPLRMLVISFSVTAGIELLQMLTHRGIFELDDLLHNTIGSMAGYFLVVAVLACVQNRKIVFMPVAKALVIPLGFTALFTTAIVAYHGQELGNMPIRPAISQSMTDVEVHMAIDLPRSAESVAMYYNPSIHNLEYSKEVLTRLMEQFSLEQKGRMRMDGNNRVLALVATDGTEYTFNYSVSDGTWSLGRTGIRKEVDDEAILEKQAGILTEWFVDSGFLSPVAQLSIQDAHILRWESNAPENIGDEQNAFFSGVVMVWPSSQRDIPEEIFYAMAQHTFIRVVEVISPYEAFKEVEKGRFNQYNDIKAGDVMVIYSFKRIYVYDTKGYYRPAYQFEGTLNNEPWNCTIDAMLT